MNDLLLSPTKHLFLFDPWSMALVAIAIAAIGSIAHSTFNLVRARDSLFDAASWRSDCKHALPVTIWTSIGNDAIEILSRRVLRGQAVLAPDGDWQSAIHPDDRDAFIADWKSAFKIDREFRKFLRLRLADGSPRWVLFHGRLAGSSMPHLRIWYGTLLDVDSDRRAHADLAEFAAGLEDKIAKGMEELRVSEGRFQALFQDLNIAYAEQKTAKAKAMIDEIKAEGVTDFWKYANENPDFIDRCLSTITVSMVNDVLVRMMGYKDHQELMALPPTANAVDARGVMSLQLEAMFDERPKLTLFTTLTGKDDLRTPVAVGVNVTPDWSSSMSALVDISELQRANELILAAQEQLAKASQIAAIGAVSASIAHELDHPIASSLVEAQNALSLLENGIDPAPILASVERVIENANRMKQIVLRTREQVAKRRSPPKLIDINEVLEDTAKLLASDLKTHDTVLVVRLSQSPPIVFAEYGEIQQIVVNLITNALEAISRSKRKGTIEITVERKDEVVIVRVEDDGLSLPEAEFDMLFNALVSTKPGGMGMGLHICRSIIGSLGGSLVAENREQEGARFTVTIPGDRSILPG